MTSYAMAPLSLRLTTAVAARLGTGHVVAIDRSAAAGDRALLGCAEEFVAEPGEGPFDLVYAFRVGALDGRHPEAGRLALARIAAVLAPAGRLFVDGGDPLREVPVPR